MIGLVIRQLEKHQRGCRIRLLISLRQTFTGSTPDARRMAKRLVAN